MRGRRVIGGLGGSAVIALIAALALAAALPAGGNVVIAPPAPCSPGVVMNDAFGDGHHKPTDVLRAWLSEANGRLQAVIEVQLGTWVPEHDEPQVVGGYAFLFTVGGVTRFVRMSVDESNVATFDYGTWTLAGGFVPEGVTTGDRDTNPVGSAAAWITVPASLVAPGAILTDTFVITYDGIISGVPTDVDQAPGGTHPNDPARGPDFIVGSCAVVSIAAPASLKGAKPRVTSRAASPRPPRASPWRSRARAQAPSSRTRPRTRSATSPSRCPSVRPRAQATNTANGIDSTTRTIIMRSVVTIRAIRLPNGKTRIKGTTSPWLPGPLAAHQDDRVRACREEDDQGRRLLLYAEAPQARALAGHLHAERRSGGALDLQGSTGPVTAARRPRRLARRLAADGGGGHPHAHPRPGAGGASGRRALAPARDRAWRSRCSPSSAACRSCSRPWRSWRSSPPFASFRRGAGWAARPGRWRSSSRSDFSSTIISRT